MPVRTSSLSSRDAALTDWWRGSLGRALLAAEAELVGEAFEDVFGWELLQVGAWGGGARQLLAASRTRRQTVLAPTCRDGNRPDVIGRSAQLPINSDCMDAVLLPHTLEFAADPYAIVREVDRVLVGEGQLLVLGFQPWSFWGLRARASQAGFPPGLRRVLSERRVRDWLVLLGYEVVAERHYLFCSPWAAGSPGADPRSLLRRGLLNPLPAGAYLLKARKRIYTLTPVRLRFKEKAKVLGGLVKPTTRSTP